MKREVSLGGGRRGRGEEGGEMVDVVGERG